MRACYLWNLSLHKHISFQTRFSFNKDSLRVPYFKFYIEHDDTDAQYCEYLDMQYEMWALN